MIQDTSNGYLGIHGRLVGNMKPAIWELQLQSISADNLSPSRNP
jgi:hypothetical protein